MTPRLNGYKFGTGQGGFRKSAHFVDSTLPMSFALYTLIISVSVPGQVKDPKRVVNGSPVVENNFEISLHVLPKTGVWCKYLKI